jgi:hypothetical protein
MRFRFVVVGVGPYIHAGGHHTLGAAYIWPGNPRMRTLRQQRSVVKGDAMAWRRARLSTSTGGRGARLRGRVHTGSHGECSRGGSCCREHMGHNASARQRHCTRAQIPQFSTSGYRLRTGGRLRLSATKSCRKCQPAAKIDCHVQTVARRHGAQADRSSYEAQCAR